jgi:16S rRNA (cytidine1402-2'-O)-methyltransferase
MSGILYIIGTPIGNLKDVTYRAIETLKSVDRIVAEDTRVTSRLLNAYDIKKPMTSLRARSSRAQFEKVAEMVEDGETIAYVTDAGTPGISDPGQLLVALVRERCGDKAVVPIPGPSAITALVSAAGVHAEEFIFVGFLPHKKGRQKMLDELVHEERAILIYESPHRIKKLLAELVLRVPDKKIVIGRELTKAFEQITVGTVGEVAARLESGDIPTRGEFVVLLSA